MILRCRLSRLGRVDAAPGQSSTQLRQCGAEPAIDVKDGGEAQHSGDLADRSFVFEAQYEQQAIVRIQLRDRSGKSCYKLLPAYFCVGRTRGVIDKQVRIDLLGDKQL